MSVEGDASLFATARSSPGHHGVAAAVPVTNTDKVTSDPDLKHALKIDFSPMGRYNVIDEESEMEDHDVNGRGCGSLVIDIDGGLVDCRAELAQVRLELDSAKSEMASLLKDHEACRADLTQKQCALDEAKSEVVSWSRDFEALHQRCDAERRDSEALIELLREELKECRSRSEDDKSNLQNAIVELQLEFQKVLQDERRDSGSRIGSLSKELKDCWSKLKEMESNLEDTVRARTAHLSNELEDCKAAKNEVEGNLGEAHVKLKVLADQKKSIDGRVATLAKDLLECQARLNEMESKVKAANAKAASLFQEKERFQNEILRMEVVDTRSFEHLHYATRDVPSLCIVHFTGYNGKWYNGTNFMKFIYVMPIRWYPAEPRTFSGAVFRYSTFTEKAPPLDHSGWKTIRGNVAGFGAIFDFIYYTGRAHTYRENKFNTDVFLPAPPQHLTKFGVKVSATENVDPLLAVGLYVLFGVGTVFGFCINVKWAMPFGQACGSHFT